MRVSSQASESTYVAQPPRNRGDWSWRNLQAYERTRQQVEGGLMPLIDGLAAVEEPKVAGAAERGEKLALQRGRREGNPGGRTYTRARQTRKVTYKLTRSGITQACVASDARWLS